MRPHIRFFDDDESEELYCDVTVNDYIGRADLLLTVGCDFKTFASIPTFFLNKQPPVPIIEINTQSIINVGYTIQIKSSPEIALPQILDAFLKQK